MLLLAGMMALEYTDVQTRLVRAVLNRIEGSLGGRISYSSLTIKPLNAFVIKDLAIIDDSPWPDEFDKGISPIDTIISAKSISGTFSLLGLVHKEGVRLSRVDIKDGMLCMVTEPNKWRSNLNRFLRGPGPPEVPVEGPSLFSIRRLSVNGFRFRVHNLLDIPYRWRGVGINWGDMDYKAENIAGRNVRFTGGRLSFGVELTNVVEKSGYKAKHISGRAKCGIGKVLMNDVLIRDEQSTINVPKFTMSFKNAYSFMNYVDEVKMEGTMGATTIDGRTLRYFIDAMPDNTAKLELEAGTKVSGYVNDLHVDKFKFRDASGVKGHISCHMVGLTHFNSMMLTLEVKSLDFTTKAATRFIEAIAPSSRISVSNIADGTLFHFNGFASGPVNRLTAKGTIKADNGSLSTTLDLRNLVDKHRITEIKGSASSKDFSLGKTLGIKALGECTMRTSFRARMMPKEPSVIIDSLVINKLGILGYDYSGIAAAGKLTGKSFDGKVICNDPNLNFLFQGVCDFSKDSENALYRFYANLGYADLDALHLDKRGLNSKASCRIIANFRRVIKGEGLGVLRVEDILLEDNNGKHDVGTLIVNSIHGPEGYTATVDSKIANATFKGSGSFGNLIEDLQELSVRRHIPALYARGKGSHPVGTYDFNCNLHDSRVLLSFIKQGLYISDSTSFDLKITPDGIIKGILKSPRLALGTNYIKGTSVEFDNMSGVLNALISNKETNIAGLKNGASTITALAANNEAALEIHVNDGKDSLNYGEFYAKANFERDASDSLIITAHPLQSSFNIGGKRWKVDSSTVCKKGGDITVNGFKISHEDQEITLGGKISDSSGDSLKLMIRNLGLSILGDIGGKELDIPGAISGQALLVSGKDKLINLDVLCDSAKIKGSFVPTTGELSLDAKLNNTRLAIIEPFLKGIARNLSGCIDGDLCINGNIRNAEINSSDIKLKDAGLTLDYTGSSYILNGPVSIGNDGVHFLEVKVSDGKGGQGTISGGLVFEHLQNMRLDARLKMSNLIALSTKQTSINSIYGNLSANADVSVTGTLDNIQINGEVSTSGNGQVHIPLNSAVATTNSDLLVFKEDDRARFIDPYDEMMKTAPVIKRRRGNIGIHVHANAKPDVTAFMELNKSTGNVISASGTASVRIDMETARKEMNLVGEYLINGGKLHFELPGIVKKEFDLKDGSSLHFNGPIKNSMMDITAVYKLKTSLATLLSDTTSVSTRRQVECSINISDNINAPQIKFGIDVPDLDPGSRTKMTEALNTEDKVQKQFMALLVIGSFLPNEQSGVVNSANILYSNVGEIMSNQLNNVFRRLNIPLDLGLGYQQGKGGTDIFDVALSTQLFNNRVEIGGTLGNRKYRTSKNPNGDIVGDIDISIKLDKSGQFKLNLFSHSADEFTSFLDYSQRNGLGIAYQKEYDNFFMMLKEAFTPKKKRETPVEKEIPKRTVTIE